MKLFGGKKKHITATFQTPNASNEHIDGLKNLSPIDLDPNNTKNDLIDVYEHRIEELGQLMVEQARHLDEMSSRSRRLSSENVLLREKLSSGFEKFVRPIQSDSKSPLKAMINHQKKLSADDYVKKIQQYKEENTLLHQQADLLVQELTHANSRISELDITVESLEKDVKAHWENARKRKYFFLSDVNFLLAIDLCVVIDVQ